MEKRSFFRKSFSPSRRIRLPSFDSLPSHPLTTRPSRECPLENVHTRLIFESRIYYIHIIIIRTHRFEQDDPALNNNNNILLTCILYTLQSSVASIQWRWCKAFALLSAHNYYYFFRISRSIYLYIITQQCVFRVCIIYILIVPLHPDVFGRHLKRLHC